MKFLCEWQSGASSSSAAQQQGNNNMAKPAAAAAAETEVKAKQKAKQQNNRNAANETVMEENNKTKAPQPRESKPQWRESENNYSLPHDGENAKKAHADKNARPCQREREKESNSAAARSTRAVSDNRAVQSGRNMAKKNCVKRLCESAVERERVCESAYELRAAVAIRAQNETVKMSK